MLKANISVEENVGWNFELAQNRIGERNNRFAVAVRYRDTVPVKSPFSPSDGREKSGISWPLTEEDRVSKNCLLKGLGQCLPHPPR